MMAIRGALERIDERTLNTHDLITAHIERSETVHDQMHSRINRLARTVHVTIGGLTLVAGTVVAWIKGLFATGS